MFFNLLNLLPVMPALATLNILGIAMLDCFNLQGNGGNIFSDWIASFSKEHHKHIANQKKYLQNLWMFLEIFNQIKQD